MFIPFMYIDLCSFHIKYRTSVQYRKLCCYILPLGIRNFSNQFQIRGAACFLLSTADPGPPDLSDNNTTKSWNWFQRNLLLKKVFELCPEQIWSSFLSSDTRVFCWLTMQSTLCVYCIKRGGRPHSTSWNWLEQDFWKTPDSGKINKILCNSF